MAPLIILLVTFSIIYFLNGLLLNNKLNISLIGRISLSTMLIFTGIAHFIKTEVIVQMIPDLIPFKLEIVYFTGIIEIAAAVGLFLSKYSKLTSIMLIIFFISVLPANIYGSIQELNFGGMVSGSSYLFFRIPLQILFIWWCYYFGIKKNVMRAL